MLMTSRSKITKSCSDGRRVILTETRSPAAWFSGSDDGGKISGDVIVADLFLAAFGRLKTRELSEFIAKNVTGAKNMISKLLTTL